MKSNILVIDNETSESSVSYKKSVIDNDYCYKPDFDELIAMFLEDHESVFSTNTGNCILMVDNFGNEYSLHEYKDIDPYYFKITDEYLKKYDAEFYISINYTFLHFDYSLRSMVWSEIQTQKHNSGSPINIDIDFSKPEYINGYNICQEILKPYIDKGIAGIIPDIYAVSFCNSIGMIANDHGINYQGFLPSVYQMKKAYQYKDIMNYYIAKKKYNLPENNQKDYRLITDKFTWTCNECNKDGAFTIMGLIGTKPGVTKYVHGIEYKDFRQAIFPVFKPMKQGKSVGIFKSLNIKNLTDKIN